MRNRIKQLVQLRAGDLVPNPKNWRTHDDEQRNALRGALDEIGYIDALIARKLPGGKYELIDGHLRASLDPNEKVPVLVVDLNDEEAEKALATFDPLAAMAGQDANQLDSLLHSINVGDEALQNMLAGLAKEAGLYQVPVEETVADLSAVYAVIVEFGSEKDQAAFYERCQTEKKECRLLTL